MTVAELIDELNRFPPHHVVLVRHRKTLGAFNRLTTEDDSSIQELFGDNQNTVCIDVTNG